MAYDIFLFDLDGTLTDSSLGITNSVIYALKKYGITVEDRRSLYRFIGPPLTDSFRDFYGFSEEKALEAVGLYQYLVDFAGAGATVPICGFGYLLAKGAIEGAKESLFKAITGGLTAASMGVTAAIVFGYIFALLFKSRSKMN